MNDEDKIRNLIHQYGKAYDDRDADTMGECFTEDGEFRWSIKDGPSGGPFIGPADIAGSMRAVLDSQADTRRHVMTNLIFGGDGKTRTAVSYLTLFAHQDGMLKPMTTGVYEDVLERGDDGSWKFLSRQLVCDLPF